MRVHCRAIDGYDVEGEVIGGERFDPLSAPRDLQSIFTVRCDNGVLFEVHGWLVDVTVIEPPKFYLM